MGKILRTTRRVLAGLLVTTVVMGATPAKSVPEDTLQKLKTQTKEVLTSIAPDKHSILSTKNHKERQIANNPFGILFFRPNYILPFYHTGSPYYSIYNRTTPDNQTIMQNEFKAQLSLKLPIYRNIFHRFNIDIAYTQVSFWQVYARSQYFRETNYEPELFITYPFLRNWDIDLGVDHQSNGRGGALERSWNRTFANIQVSGTHWLLSVKPWVLIFKKDSSDVHNPDITHYLGHERVLLAFRFYGQSLALQAANIESGFKRGQVKLNWTVPMSDRFKLMVQAFSGYGQSLIEYNHRSNSIGIGFALSNWVS